MGRAGLRRLARARSDEKYASLERSAQEKYQELQQSSAQTLAKTQQSAADAEAQLTKEAAAAAVLAEEKYNSLVANNKTCVFTLSIIKNPNHPRGGMTRL